MSRKGGVLSGGFQPLKAPNAPTIDSVSAGILSASVTVSAPANTGDGTVSGYVVTAKQSDGSLATGTASSAGAVSVTLTAGGTTEFAAQAFSEYGPGQFSGFGNSTAIPSGQELYSWGYNGQGQLGHNDIANRSSPVQIGALTTWSQIASGQGFSLAIKTNGTMFSWGSNTVGQLGRNDYAINRSSPVQIGALTTWSKIAGGASHSLAVKTDGTMWSWGNSGSGELGHNEDTNRSSPVQVGALTTWYQIAAGSSFSLAVKTDGTLWSWGFGSYGQLGHNDAISRSSPVQIGALTTWSQVTAGAQHSFAIKTDGTMWSWGLGSNGRLGHNNVISRSSPVQVGALTTWAQVAGGGNSGGNSHSVALKTDGTLWSWGYGGNGRLGHNNLISHSSPVQIGALTTWSQIAAGQEFNLAIKTDGTLWSWGQGSAGQIGDGAADNRSSPVQIGALTTWSQLPKMNLATHSLAIQQSFT
jgi:alpha-tubulin suppressor-like RCC1 family protein